MEYEGKKIAIAVSINKYKYEDFVILIGKLIKQDNLIKKVAGKALQHSKEKHVLDLVNNFIVNATLRSGIESYCKSNLQVQTLELVKEDEKLTLSVIISDYNLGRVLEVLIGKLEKNKKEMMGLLVIPITKIINGTLSEEQKENILLDIINDCQKGIAAVLENVAQKQGLELEIGEISCYKINSEE